MLAICGFPFSALPLYGSLPLTLDRVIHAKKMRSFTWHMTLDESDFKVKSFSGHLVFRNYNYVRRYLLTLESVIGAKRDKPC